MFVLNFRWIRLRVRYVLLLTLFGCGPKVEPIRGIGTAETLLAAAWNQDSLLAYQADFTVAVRSPDGGGSTVGGVIIHAPDRVRLELQTPFYTPLIALASDGSALDIWLHYAGVFLEGDDALSVVENTTNGAVGMRDLLVLLMGRLPLNGADVVELGWIEEEVGVRLAIDESFYAVARLEPESKTIRWFEIWRSLHIADGEDVLMLRVEVMDTMRVGRSWFPEELHVELPVIEWQIVLDVENWEALGVIPDVFDLTPNSDVPRADLVETIRALLTDEYGRPAE